MYTIKAYITDSGGNITTHALYNPLMPYEGCVITEGKVTLELGKAGSASISIPKFYGVDENGQGLLHPLYDSLQKMKTIIQVMYKPSDPLEPETEVFYGRILHDDRGIDGEKKLYVEGALTFLIDRMMVPPPKSNGYKYNSDFVFDGVVQGNAKAFFEYCIKRYNEQTVGVEPLKILRLTNDEQTETFDYVSPAYSTTTLEFEEHECTTVQDALYNKLIDVCGGYIKIRYIGRDADMLPMHTIDYVTENDIDDTEPGAFHHCGQVIRLGENLLDISEYVSGEDTATVIVPLGKMQTETVTDSEGHQTTVNTERVNIAGYTDTDPPVPYNTDYPGEMYVADTIAQGAYGNIWQIVVFDDIEDPAELFLQAKAYLNAHKNLTKSLTVSAVDLELLGADPNRINIGDYVQVDVPGFSGGTSDGLQCIKIVIDLLNPANNAYTFEHLQKTLSERQSATESGVKSIATAMSDGGGPGGNGYAALEARVLNLERAGNVNTTEETTIMDIYNALENLKTESVYLGSDVTDRPHETGVNAVGGVLDVRRVTELYGSMTYYANNGIVWCAFVKEDPDNPGEQLLSEWKKVKWDE